MLHGAASGSRRWWRSSRRSRSRPSCCRPGGIDRLDVGANLERDLRDDLPQALELLVAGDEIGLGMTSSRPPWSPPSARRSDPRPRRGQPSWRPSTGPSCAANRVPPAGSRRSQVRAAFQSIMPAPVNSRKSLTVAAVIVAIVERRFAGGIRRGEAEGFTAAISGFA